MNISGRTLARAVACLALFSLLVLPAACESSSSTPGGTTTNPDGGSPSGGNDTGLPPIDTTGGGPDFTGKTMTTFKATLKDFQNKQPDTSGVAQCELLWNVYETGPGEFDANTGGRTGIVVQAGANGEIQYDLPENTKWGWLCTKTGNKNTYQFNISSTSTDFADEELWLISNGLYSTAASAGGVRIDDTLGLQAGRLVYINTAGDEEYVGCATVAYWQNGVEAQVDFRYFRDSDLPQPLAERDKTNPVNGLFIGANIPVGNVTIHGHGLQPGKQAPCSAILWLAHAGADLGPRYGRDSQAIRAAQFSQEPHYSFSAP